MVHSYCYPRAVGGEVVLETFQKALSIVVLNPRKHTGTKKQNFTED